MNRGFTIIETLLVVAVILILLGVIIVPFKKINDSQALSKETLNVVSIINRARSETLSAKDGLQHGIHLENAQVVLFSGPTYVVNDPGNISVTLHPLVNISNISLSGGTSDIVFEKLTGTTLGFGTITLSLVASSTQAKTISINSTGIVNADP